MQNKVKNGILIFICITLLIVPFVLHRDSEFEGSDAQGEEMIIELQEDYEPWVSPIFDEIPGEIETLLFTLQAAIGGGFIGYYIGRNKNVKGNSGVCKTKSIC